MSAITLSAMSTQANQRGMMMNHSFFFGERVAVRYSKQPVADEATYQKKLQITREYFLPNINVLEIGCGTGGTSIAHAPYVKHILALDISSKMIELARDKADAKRVKNVTFKRSSIDEFNTPDQTFEAVLALSVLHLLDNREEVIAKVYKMLKPWQPYTRHTVARTIGWAMSSLETPQFSMATTRHSDLVHGWKALVLMAQESGSCTT
ncbi:MAG: class I SAM-dependent methyltransferase [bacterium]